MQITFNPDDPKERSLIASVLSVWDNGSEFTEVPVQTTDEQPTVTVSADTPVTGIAPAPVETPTAAGETDIHGMVWDDSIHSTPATKNADGSWRAKRGCKEEYEAAIAAHKAGQTAAAGGTMVQPEQAPSGTAMPMPGMPAAPAPQTPQEPIDYAKLTPRFIGKMQSGEIGDFEVVYRDLGIDHTQLETNQTMIENLWRYMDALDAGQDHAAAVATVNAG